MDNLSLQLALENGNSTKYSMEANNKPEKPTVTNQIFIVNNENYMTMNRINSLYRVVKTRPNDVNSTRWLIF